MSNSIDAYVNSERYQNEIERIYKTLPLALCLSSEISNANSHRAMKVIDTPVLVTRGEDMKARAFLNVCRHRGSQVCEEGRGEKRNFICPYHAWTYNHEGKLVGMYGEKTFGDLNKQEFGLIELNCEERAGLIWVTLSPEVQFDIGYAHFEGSGSAGNTTKLTTGGRQSAAMYRQFANVVLAPQTEKFSMTSAPSGSPDFYFIAFNRARMREKIDPGNWELVLSGSVQKPLKLIDDSGATNSPTVNEGGRVFNVVTGSLETGTGVTKTAAASETGGGIGLFYPDLGIIVLNATHLDNYQMLATGRNTDAFADNPRKFFDAIVAGKKFQVRR